MPYGPVSAKVNNKVEGLHYRFYNDKDVEFLDVTSSSGMRTYTRSLFFVLVKAVKDLFPGCVLRIETPVSRGYYCDLRIGRPIEEDDVTAIWRRMREIVGELRCYLYTLLPVGSDGGLFLRFTADVDGRVEGV